MSEPLNPLEAALFDALARRITMAEFLAALTAAKIVIPSASEVLADGSGLAPITHRREETELIVAFTDPARIGDSLTAQAPYRLHVDAAWIIRHMALDLGLLLFAGPDRGLMLTPAQLADVRAKL
jgi:hypothetical protein